jgi:hypothetical protein
MPRFGSLPRRRAAGCLLAAALSACGQNRPSAPTGPTEPPSPPAPAVPTVSVTGRVLDRVSGQPIPGVQVSALPRTGYWTLFNTLRVTDAAGRYTISGIPADFRSFWVMASTTLYPVQQCATVASVDGADGTQDVTLTSRDDLTAGNSRVALHTPGTRIISGVVSEITELGRQPVEGVWLGFETGNTVNDQPVIGAWTFTDGRGGYLLCGLPETQLSLALYESRLRRSVRQNVEAGSDTVLDIELKR